jgi:hypothetical protein
MVYPCTLSVQGRVVFYFNPEVFVGRDPAFLFYDADAARDVSHMNRLERGCYFDLIQAQLKFGSFTTDQARKILGKEFSECWGAIELILTKEEDKFLIPWVKESVQRRMRYSDMQRQRANERWHNPGNATAMPRQCLKENENAIESVIKDEKLVKRANNIIKNTINKERKEPEDFIAKLKQDPAYKGIDIDRELLKAQSWIKAHPGRKMTHRFFLNWINKVDPEIKMETQEKELNPLEKAAIAWRKEQGGLNLPTGRY